MKTRIIIGLCSAAILTGCSASSPDSSPAQTTVQTTILTTAQTTIQTTAQTTAETTAKSITSLSSVQRSYTAQTTMTSTAAVKTDPALTKAELGLDLLTDTANTIRLDKHSDGIDLSEEIEPWVYPRFANLFDKAENQQSNTEYVRYCDIPEQYQEQYTLTVSDQSGEIYTLTVISDEETDQLSASGKDYFKLLIADKRKQNSGTVCCLASNTFRQTSALFWKNLVPVEKEPEQAAEDTEFLKYVFAHYTFQTITYNQDAETTKQIPAEDVDSYYQLLKSYFTEHDLRSLEYDYFSTFWHNAEFEKNAPIRIALTRPPERPWDGKQSMMTVTEPYEIRFSCNQRFAAVMEGDMFTTFRLEDPEALRPLFDLLNNPAS